MSQFDLIVIGAGPGGYIAAIRAAQLGMNVACVEQEPALGGTCLRVGCIPSKALLESSERYVAAQHDLEKHGVKVSGVKLDLKQMLRRKDGLVGDLTKGVEGLFRKNKVTRYAGHARISGPGAVQVDGRDGRTELRARSVIIATGSRSAPLKGVELDYERIGTSTEALAYDEVPQRLVVIGAGYIGLELGSVWSRLGSKVTVLEYLDRILPGMDAEIASDALKLFRKQGIEFVLGARVTGARADKKGAVVEYELSGAVGGNGAAGVALAGAAAASAGGAASGGAARSAATATPAGTATATSSGGGGRESIRCDRVLLAVGRVPNTDDLGLESVGIRVDSRGRIEVDERFQTSAPGFYAIGDVIRGPMLAHKAEEEGVACAEQIATGYGHVNYDAIPGVVYTHPEIASVGRSEEELQAAGVAYRKGVFHYRANARARALGETEGKVKMLADARTDRVLGVHILGARAGDLIAEAAVAIEFGASSEDIARSSHAHPRLAEIVKEAALAVDGRTLNA